MVMHLIREGYPLRRLFTSLTAAKYFLPKVQPCKTNSVVSVLLPLFVIIAPLLVRVSRVSYEDEILKSLMTLFSISVFLCPELPAILSINGNGIKI